MDVRSLIYAPPGQSFLPANFSSNLCGSELSSPFNHCDPQNVSFTDVRNYLIDK